jgi:prepilin-type processing-associated H-X9-DG protein
LAQSVIEVHSPPPAYVDDDGLPLPTSYKRLREGIERFFITDINNPAAAAVAQSSLFVMWDAFAGSGTYFQGAQDNPVIRFNHIPGGSNVLYMDGHVEFIKFNSKPPVYMTGDSPWSFCRDQNFWPWTGGWG